MNGKASRDNDQGPAEATQDNGLAPGPAQLSQINGQANSGQGCNHGQAGQ